MNPITHYLIGWLLANTVDLDRRDRVIVSLGAVIPDTDGMGIVAEIATRNSARSFVPPWAHIVCVYELCHILFSTLPESPFSLRSLRSFAAKTSNVPRGSAIFL